MTQAEDRAPLGTDPSAEGRGCERGPGGRTTASRRCPRPPSPFAYSTNAINPSGEQQPKPANPPTHGFHFTLNQDSLLNMVEMAFRAYDPCMACATHSLPGQMPLVVTVLGSQGQVLERLSQSVDRDAR
jgi:F420-non-reducing hydrogenase large subunit